MKVLPKRPHLGCDPICERCDAAIENLTDDLRPVVERGLLAFWKSVRAQLGMKLIPVGDPPPYTHPEDLNQAALDCVVDLVTETLNANRPRLRRPKPKPQKFEMGECGELQEVK